MAQAGEDFEISWNHNADTVRNASAGSLTIRNGLATRVLAMRPEMESISTPMKRIPGWPWFMKLPMPQPGSNTVALLGTPRWPMASWMALMTSGEV